MNQSEKNIYINIRAEQIKYHQDKTNGHLFTEPYSIETAKKIAINQLNCDLENDNLRITLEELLLNDNETCIRIIRNDSKRILEKLY